MMLLLPQPISNYSASRQLTRNNDLQQLKPRRPERLQLPPGETGSSNKRIVHTAVYKQKLTLYDNASELYEQNFDQLLF